MHLAACEPFASSALLAPLSPVPLSSEFLSFPSFLLRREPALLYLTVRFRFSTDQGGSWEFGGTVGKNVQLTPQGPVDIFRGHLSTRSYSRQRSLFTIPDRCIGSTCYREVFGVFFVRDSGPESDFQCAGGGKGDGWNRKDRSKLM